MYSCRTASPVMSLADAVAALEQLGRRELQQLAKEHGLRANAKSEELIASLCALHAQAGNAEPEAAEPMEEEEEAKVGEPGSAAEPEAEAGAVEAEELGGLARRLSPLFCDAAKTSTNMLDSPVAGLVTATAALHVQQRRGGGGGVAASPLPAGGQAGLSWCVVWSGCWPRVH